MRKIFLARHAEGLLHGRFCGSSDPELSPKGEQEAGELALKFRAAGLSHIYCSPLRRAFMTAREIEKVAQCGLTVMEALREIDFGLWEGLCWEEIQLGWPGFAQRWVKEFPVLAAPEGETFRTFTQRVESAFLRIREDASQFSGDVCVVTHGGVIKTLLASLTGRPFQAIPMIPTATVQEVVMNEDGLCVATPSLG